MTTRSFVARYQADITSYRAAMGQMRADTMAAAREISASATRNRADFQQLGTGVGLAGAAMAVAIGKMVTAAARFDTEMSAVAAATGALQHEMHSLREAALAAGAATAFSASEAAQGQIELAKAGVSTADILGGALSGALDLAAAGQIGVAQSAEIAATAMTQFALEGDQVGHIADLLAAGANKAQGGVGDLGAALNQSGLVASQFDLSLESTVGTLAAFASNGMVGSDAGTSLRTMLLRMANPADEAAEKMSQLGIAAYDASGDFVGMESLAGQLQTALGGLTQAERDQALALIFGQDAIRAANILYAQGEEGVRRWTEAVNDQGAAQRTASKLLDNLMGDLEEFGGAVETALIEFGEEGDGALRSVVQAGTGVVRTFAAMPDPLQKVALGLGGLASAAGVSTSALLLGVTAANRYKASLATVGAGAVSMRGALAGTARVLTGPWGLAIGVATLGLGAYAAQAGEARGRILELTASIEADSGALGENSRRVVANTLLKNGALEAAEKLGIHGSVLVDAALGEADAIRSVNETLGEHQRLLASGVETTGMSSDAARNYARDTSDAMRTISNAVGEGRDEVEKAVHEHKLLAEAERETAATTDLAELAASGYNRTMSHMDSTMGLLVKRQWEQEAASRQNTISMAGLEGVIDRTNTTADRFSKIIAGMVGNQRDLDEASDAWEAALDDLTESIKDNGTTLDGTTEKGRANKDAMREAVEGAEELTRAFLANGGSAQEAEGRLLEMRDRLLATATASGMSREAAEAYIEQLGLTPTGITTLVRLVTNDAIMALSELRNQLRDITDEKFTIPVAVRVSGRGGVGLTAGRAINEARAKVRHWGGPVDGHAVPGLAHDERLIVAQTGEHVLSRLQTQAVRPLLNALPRFHNGGPVTVGMSAGRLAPDPAVGYSATVVRGMLGGAGPSADALDRTVRDAERLNSEWAEAVRLQDEMTRRSQLLADIERAKADAAKAETADAREAARERIADATGALRDFDVDRARANEERAISEALSAAETELARRRQIEANRAEWEFSRMAVGEQLADLDRRIAAEQEFTDEWEDLHEQRARVVDEERDRLERAANDAEREAEDQLGLLNRMLDERARVLDRMAEAEESFAQRSNEVMDRYNADRLAAERKFNDTRRSILEQRARDLESFARLDERFSGGGFANSVGALTRNARMQEGLLGQWGQTLSDLRARGLSEQVISALGLDDPRQMRQAMMLAQATDAELADYSAAVAQRTATIRDVVEREGELLIGTVGRGIRDANAEYERELGNAYDRMVDDLDRLKVDFAATTAALRDELALIGVDTGRSYADAVAEGIAAGLPGILAQVDAVKAATRELNSAQAALGGNGMQDGRVSADPRDNLARYRAGELNREQYRANVEQFMAGKAAKYHGGGVVPQGIQSNGERLLMALPGERVLSGQQTQAFERLVDVLAGGGTINLTVQNVMEGKIVGEWHKSMHAQWGSDRVIAGGR